MSRAERIALVVAQTTGGIGRHVLSLVSEIKRRGGVPLVFGPETVREFRFEEEGAEFAPVEFPPGMVSTTARLARSLRGADLVHAHGMRAGIAAGIASKKAGVAHRVVTIHNAVLNRRGLRGAAAWTADRLMAYLMTVRICVSSDLARAARKAAPSHAGSVEVIPVGADVSPPAEAEVARARDSIGAAPGVPLIVALGRLHRQKGFDVLIESIPLVSVRPAPLIVIAGEGPERAQLSRRITSLHLEDQVRLLGHRDNARLIAAAADIFCMPSRWEGSSLALHEAMAAARPIVTTRVGGIEEMLPAEAALFVPPDDPAALAAALDTALSDPALRMRLGESAAKAAAAWPDASTTAARVVHLYEQILGRPLGSE